jgi:hypothetical protein
VHCTPIDGDINHLKVQWYSVMLYLIGSIAFLTVFATTAWRMCVVIERFEAQRIRLAMRLREAGFDAPFEANWYAAASHSCSCPLLVADPCASAAGSKLTSAY